MFLYGSDDETFDSTRQKSDVWFPKYKESVCPKLENNGRN